MIIEVIEKRRNIKEFTEEKISEDSIKYLLNAAIWAPNHRKTEPWRFIVIPKNSKMRIKLANHIYDWNYKNASSKDENAKKEIAKKEKIKILNAPALIYVYYIEDSDPEVDKENYSAVSCAIQNLMLAAHEIGIGVGWSTGMVCKAKVETLIGAEPDWEIAGALFLGKPKNQTEGKRKPINECTIWH